MNEERYISKITCIPDTFTQLGVVNFYIFIVRFQTRQDWSGLLNLEVRFTRYDIATELHLLEAFPGHAVHKPFPSRQKLIFHKRCNPCCCTLRLSTPALPSTSSEPNPYSPELPISHKPVSFASLVAESLLDDLDTDTASFTSHNLVESFCDSS